MHFHVVDQHRGRDHTALRHIARAADQWQRRLVVQEFEHVVIVAGGQNILQRTRVQAAEPQAAHQFFPAVRIHLVYQHRRAYRMAAALPGIAQHPPDLFERSRRRKIHLAHDHSVRLVALPAHLDQLLLQIRHWRGFGGAHEKVADAPRHSRRSCRASAPGRWSRQNPVTGCRVSRKFFSTPFSTSVSGPGATPSRSTS